MATGGVGGNGVKVAYSVSSPVSWNRIGQLADQELPGLISDKIGSSVHGSRLKRTMPGMLQVTPLKLTLVADLDPVTSASHAALDTYVRSGATIYFRVEVPANRLASSYVAWEFQGYVSSWQPKSPLEGRQEIDAEIEFDDSTLVKYAPGASAIS